MVRFIAVAIAASLFALGCIMLASAAGSTSRFFGGTLGFFFVLGLLGWDLDFELRPLPTALGDAILS